MDASTTSGSVRSSLEDLEALSERSEGVGVDIGVGVCIVTSGGVIVSVEGDGAAVINSTATGSSMGMAGIGRVGGGGRAGASPVSVISKVMGAIGVIDGKLIGISAFAAACFFRTLWFDCIDDRADLVVEASESTSVEAVSKESSSAPALFSPSAIGDDGMKLSLESPSGPSPVASSSSSSKPDWHSDAPGNALEVGVVDDMAFSSISE